METPNTQNKQKLNFENSQYLIETLPDEAKRLVNALRTADVQSKMYKDTLDLISISKTKIKTALEESDAKIFAILGAGDIGLEIKKLNLKKIGL